jgi:hypothetical protein
MRLLTKYSKVTHSPVPQSAFCTVLFTLYLFFFSRSSGVVVDFENDKKHSCPCTDATYKGQLVLLMNAVVQSRLLGSCCSGGWKRLTAYSRLSFLVFLVVASFLLCCCSLAGRPCSRALSPFQQAFSFSFTFSVVLPMCFACLLYLLLTCTNALYHFPCRRHFILVGPWGP